MICLYTWRQFSTHYLFPAGIWLSSMMLTSTDAPMETLDNQTLGDIESLESWFAQAKQPRRLMFIVIIFATIAGVIANTILIVMFRVSQTLHSTTNLLMEILSCLNLTMSILVLPITGTSLLVGRFIGDRLAVIVFGFAMIYLGLSSINILTAIAVERYTRIVYPHVKILLLPSRIKLGLLFCFTLPLLWAITPVIGWNDYALEGLHVSSSINWLAKRPSEFAYISLLTTSFSVPLAIICYTYASMLLKVSKFASAHVIENYD